MKRIALAATVAALLASPAAAQAPRPCGNPADIARRLATEYREAPTARGVDSRGNLVTVYSNPDTGTWTVIVFAPAVGCALVAASGEGWGAVDYALPATGSGS